MVTRDGDNVVSTGDMVMILGWGSNGHLLTTGCQGVNTGAGAGAVHEGAVEEVYGSTAAGTSILGKENLLKLFTRI